MMNITQGTSIKFIALLTVCSLLAPLFTQSASAVTKADWNASRIIDDAVFFNPDRMSVQEIQNFLNAKVPTCDTNGEKMYNDTQTRAQWAQANNRPLPPYTCLKSYTQNIPGIAADSYCSGSVGAGTKSAATIIKEVALACNINPQVILVTLQKEQGLITDDWPWPVQYTKATGMGCPDTSLGVDVDANQNGCYDDYEGFFKQIYYGARQFQRYVKQPDVFNYAMGRNSYIAYQANNADCGGTYITPQTNATAALYNYTPYQPNTAALDNMYGRGDGCSAYGNRNFWRMFNDWFGSTYVPVNVKYEAGDATIDNTGDTARIPVKLIDPPISNVILNFSTTDTSLAKIISNASVTFTPSNWNTLQYITVQGLSSNASSKNLTLYVTHINSPDGAYDQSVTKLIKKQPLLWAQQQDRPIYRLHNPNTGMHGYAISQGSRDSLVSSGYNLEGIVGYQCSATKNTPLIVRNDLGLVRNIDSPDITDKEAATPMIMFSNESGSQFTTLLRSSDSVDSVISQSSAEVDYLVTNGYIKLTSFLLCKQTDNPIYRLYNSAKGVHFHTPHANEAAKLESYGFKNEGLNRYVTSSGTHPIYRLYNPAKETHFYTASTSEKTAVEKLGFKYEGVAYYRY